MEKHLNLARAAQASEADLSAANPTNTPNTQPESETPTT
jgi:hypothetical protein